MKKKYQKKRKRKSQRIQKNNDSPKIEKKERGKSGTISRGAHRERHLSCFACADFCLVFTSLDTSGTWNVNRLATKTSTRDTYSVSPGSEILILAKNWSQDPLFVVTSFLSILSMSSEFSIGMPFTCVSSYFLWLLLLLS